MTEPERRCAYCAKPAVARVLVKGTGSKMIIDVELCAYHVQRREQTTRLSGIATLEVVALPPRNAPAPAGPGAPLLEMDFVTVSQSPYGGPEPCKTEDAGQARIAEFSPDPCDHVFLRLQSWYDRAEDGPEPDHPEIDRVIGKRVRVHLTITEEAE